MTMKMTYRQAMHEALKPKHYLKWQFLVVVALLEAPLAYFQETRVHPYVLVFLAVVISCILEKANRIFYDQHT